MPGLAGLAERQDFRHRLRPFLSASLVVTDASAIAGSRESAAAHTEESSRTDRIVPSGQRPNEHSAT
jgi:hypothetical protein